MPFDPDKYLATKQAEQADAPSTGKGFDPDQYLQSKGVQTLPGSGGIQDGASAAEAYARNATPAGQGFAGGFGKQLNSGIQSAAGAVDQIVNGQNNFGDQSAPDASLLQRAGDALSNIPANYSRASTQVAGQLADTRAKHPLISALTEIAASIPSGVVGGAALKSAGLANTTAQVGLLGGAYGYGSSNNEGFERVKDAGKAAATAIAFAKTLEVGAKALKGNVPAFEEYINYDNGTPAADTLNPNNVGVSVKPRPNGDFDIKFGSDYKAAVKLGAEESKLLKNPELQAKVTDEVNNVFGTDERPGVIPQLIDKTKKSIGTVRDGVLKDKGSVAVDVEGALKKAYDGHSTIAPEGNDIVQKAKDAFKERLETIEGALRTKSPTNSLNDVPLRDAFEQKQQLGELLFGKNKAYQMAQPVRREALTLYHALKNATNDADTSGAVRTVNNVYHALYSMGENPLTPKQVESLTSPVANVARNAYKDFINPLLKLDPNTRASLMPELQNYIADQLPITLQKASVVKAVNNHADSAGGLGWVLNKLYLNKSSALQGLGALGKASTMEMPDTSRLGNAIEAVRPYTPTPALGALATDNNKPQGGPALNELK